MADEAKPAEAVDIAAIEKAVEAKPEPAETKTPAEAPKPAKQTSTPKRGAAKPKPVKAKATKPQVSKPKTSPKPAQRSLEELKEQIVAKTETKTPTDFYQDMMGRSTEMTEFSKANVEAMVEAGKVLTTGMQDMGRSYVEDMKSAVETLQDDAKKVSAVTSPTELLQLQGELARRNFDTAVAQTSRNVEQMMKLANDVFAPLSTRMSVAMDKARAA